MRCSCSTVCKRLLANSPGHLLVIILPLNRAPMHLHQQPLTRKTKEQSTTSAALRAAMHTGVSQQDTQQQSCWHQDAVMAPLLGRACTIGYQSR